jgi:antitoxin HicB
MLEINALFEPDTEVGGFVVTFPDFPWGITQGDTEAEATEMAQDAIALVIEELIRRGAEIPEKSRVRGRKYRTIRLPAMQTAKVELYRQFRASGLRKVDLARRLGIPKTVVDRLFDLNHHSRLDQIEAAFAVLGKRLAVQIEDAA